MENMFVVLKDGQQFVAYPRRVQAEAYAATMSDSEKGIEIIECILTPAKDAF